MKTFLWYKKKILFSSKGKLAGLIIIPIIYYVLYTALKVDHNISMFFFGISIPLMYTYVLFTVGDLTRVNCFIAAGERLKKMWLANVCFVTFVGIIMSLIFQGAAGLYFCKDLKECADHYLITLCQIPFVAFFVGLSTLHFRNYSKGEVAVSSVFALLNALFFFLPMLALVTDLTLDIRIAGILGIVGLAGMFLLNIYMSFSDNETLVMNAAKEISLYDKSMLGLNEE